MIAHADVTIAHTPFFRLRDQLLPLISLKELLGLESDNGDEGSRYIIIAQIGAYQFGIIVDKVFDTEEIVVKPVSNILRNIEIFSGNTILGDGSVIMILDPNGIAKAMGETDISDANAGKKTAQDENKIEKTSLLLFSTADGTPKAVPLSLVARLEEIDTANIEMSSGSAMIQYRGQLMPLMPFDHSVNLKTPTWVAAAGALGSAPITTHTYTSKATDNSYRHGQYLLHMARLSA